MNARLVAQKACSLALALGAFYFLGCITFKDADDLTYPDSGADADTDADTDSDTDTDTDVDTDSDADTDADTDTDTDADTDSDTDSDTDELAENGQSCKANGDCLSGHCDHEICCDAGTCCTSGSEQQCEPYRCDTSLYQCRTDCTANSSDNDDLCIDGYHCDDGYCDTDALNGQACDETSDCQSNYCEGNVCCDSGECCADQTDCATEKPICSDTFQCVPCIEQDKCADQYPETPFCDDTNDTDTATQGQCLQCRNTADCHDIDISFTSPLGLCTPDHTCTCVVQTEKWACEKDADCLPNWRCAQDHPTESHYVCLRECDPTSGPTKGLACANRNVLPSGQAQVWAPMTTCYAFEKFGTDCDTDQDVCSIDGVGTGIADAECVSKVCTYSCWDGLTGQDDWCPNGSTCPYPPDQYCEVP